MNSTAPSSGRFSRLKKALFAFQRGSRARRRVIRAYPGRQAGGRNARALRHDATPSDLPHFCRAILMRGRHQEIAQRRARQSERPAGCASYPLTR
ncbi:hypothetical protein PsYK624_090600 [Phanerochaete sordida]|uniref:Uncharacterized protein n=1 Tax=Phanerochaete sordida TaxID=48140 RepID=A0A9P3GBV5_9APHY|nr:hypothetical protein PsYK624_090600 [Phanerochaete sordida]